MHVDSRAQHVTYLIVLIARRLHKEQVRMQLEGECSVVPFKRAPGRPAAAESRYLRADDNQAGSGPEAIRL